MDMKEWLRKVAAAAAVWLLALDVSAQYPSVLTDAKGNVIADMASFQGSSDYRMLAWLTGKDGMELWNWYVESYFYNDGGGWYAVTWDGEGNTVMDPATGKPMTPEAVAAMAAAAGSADAVTLPGGQEGTEYTGQGSVSGYAVDGTSGIDVPEGYVLPVQYGDIATMFPEEVQRMAEDGRIGTPDMGGLIGAGMKAYRAYTFGKDVYDMYRSAMSIKGMIEEYRGLSEAYRTFRKGGFASGLTGGGRQGAADAGYSGSVSYGHDGDNYNQWASMEFAQWSFTPKEYYYSWYWGVIDVGYDLHTLFGKVHVPVWIPAYLPGWGIHDNGFGGTGLPPGDHYVDEEWRRMLPLRGVSAATESLQKGPVRSADTLWGKFTATDAALLADSGVDAAYAVGMDGTRETEENIRLYSALLTPALAGDVLAEYGRIRAEADNISSSSLNNSARLEEYAALKRRLLDLESLAAGLVGLKLAADAAREDGNAGNDNNR